MKIRMSHLRNSIAVLLTVIVLAVASFGPVCAPACAQGTKHACCEDGRADCGTHAASSAGACGHVVELAAERQEQPTAAVVGFVALPVRMEFLRGRSSAGVLMTRVADLPPPRRFDPLVVSLRV